MARSNGAPARPHRVAIVGGGFGGLFAARALRHAEAEVTVIVFVRRALEQQPGAWPAVRAPGKAWLGAGGDGRSTEPGARTPHSHF
jgi:cation diffusion facilitator CzcD-associated flavoprotein CzcO